jgi:tetratricopeptide (TPR) repeat protein
MDKLESSAQFIEARWHTKLGLIILETFVLFSVFSLTVNHFSIGISILITICISIGIALVWLHSIRIPKTSKNKVGFLVAITCNDSHEKIKIDNDFIEPLHRLIKSGQNGHTFDFIVLNQYQSKKIISNDDAEKVRLKANAHFMVYGNVRLRNINDIDTHIIELEGIVSHKQVDSNSTTAFSQEFAELLPRRVHASTVNDVIFLQLTSEWTEIVAKYIIATAAALSGDLEYSEMLYTEIKIKLPLIESKIPVYTQLKHRVPLRLSEINLIKSQRNFDEWVKNKDDLSLLENADNLLNELLPEHQSLDTVTTLKALNCFLLNRDTQGALKLLNSINKRVRNQVWHLNVAFIFAYTAKLNNAARSYRIAAIESSNPSILSQVEDFIVWIIEQEPDKFYLFYALGYFNWKIKGDTKMAKSDFEKFLSNPLAKLRFPKEAEISNDFIREQTY